MPTIKKSEFAIVNLFAAVLDTLVVLPTLPFSHLTRDISQETEALFTSNKLFAALIHNRTPIIAQEVKAIAEQLKITLSDSEITRIASTMRELFLNTPSTKMRLCNFFKKQNHEHRLEFIDKLCVLNTLIRGKTKLIRAFLRDNQILIFPPAKSIWD